MKHLAHSQFQQMLPVIGVTRMIMITAPVGSLPIAHSCKILEKNAVFAEVQLRSRRFVSFLFFVVVAIMVISILDHLLIRAKQGSRC